MLLCSDYVSLCCRGYVNQYFDNKEEDVHKDTFRQIAIDVPRMSPLVGLFQQRLVQEMVERILYIWAIRCFILSLKTSSIEIDTLKLIYNVYKCFILPILSIWSLSMYIDHDVCRHPASGYVQGINDLVTPFLMVFLQVHKIFIIQQFWLKPPFSLSPRTLWKKMLQEWASSSLILRLVWGKTLRLIRFGAWPRYDIYMCQSTSYGGIIIYEMIW